MKATNCFSILCTLITLCLCQQDEAVRISKSALKDKIKGAWAGQVIGCTFGGPTEFRFRGTMIQDYQPIPWYDGYLKWTYENRPGLYDDIYMDLTFVDVFEKQGLDAPAKSFAMAFAHAEYPLWHANQAARYNILQGIMPPNSGHWLNNPHADDIDFQIEADFAGIMCPGMINRAMRICDKIGHIMNYGDGYYGGAYVAAMYSLAFISDDPEYVVKQALKVIPQKTTFAQCMQDVIQWYEENPNDWKQTWFNVQEKWSEDVGCPNGVFTSFNIDAKINSAWILVGLLYGQKDFGQTISISTRCGDDSDCNPASAAGILGAMIGYNRIPDYWKLGLKNVEPIDFKYTDISLEDAYKLSYQHALSVIEEENGQFTGSDIIIKIQQPKTIPFEQGFTDHFPVERRSIGIHLKNEHVFNFSGVGFAIDGHARKLGDNEHVFIVEMIIDGESVQTSQLPTHSKIRKVTPFWTYQLSPGEHQVYLKVLNPVDHAEIVLNDLIVYDNKKSQPKY